MKYDPWYHKNVVNNVRRLFQDEFSQPCPLTDEKIYQEYSEMSASGLEDKDILEILRDMET